MTVERPAKSPSLVENFIAIGTVLADMSDEAELEYEAELTREAIADHLEAFAGTLRGGGSVEFDVGGRTVVVDPPERLEFEVEIEDEPESGGVERSIEFELEWMRRAEEEPIPGSKAPEDVHEEPVAETEDSPGDETTEADESTEDAHDEAASEVEESAEDAHDEAASDVGESAEDAHDKETAETEPSVEDDHDEE